MNIGIGQEPNALADARATGSPSLAPDQVRGEPRSRAGSPGMTGVGWLAGRSCRIHQLTLSFPAERCVSCARGREPSALASASAVMLEVMTQSVMSQSA